jgi:hypothetical protein
MKSKQKFSYSFFACLLMCLLPISCDDNVAEEKAPTKAEKIVEIDKTGAKYGVIIEFNPEDADKVSLSEIESLLKSLSIQPKELGIYTFQGEHIILNSKLPKIED